MERVELRQYQGVIRRGIDDAWQNGARAVLVQCPTGGGKTPILADTHDVMRDVPSVSIAHRKELVGQISMAMARCGVRHRIIGPPELVRYVVRRQQYKFGRDYYNPNSNIAVAAVDTLVRRQRELEAWRHQVRLWTLDEGHHLLRENKWGKAVRMFPNAIGAGFTATACRADGKGLGRDFDGYYDDLVVGPSGRWLIQNGWLCDYQVATPMSDMKVEGDVGSTGDWSSLQLKKAAEKSHIVGDTVGNWLALCPGRQTIVFAPDLDSAARMAEKFRTAGVAAEFVSGETPADVRNEVLDRFERGELTVLINVDLFGEGFDVPAVEVVVMARPTESFGLYCQMFGRALRIMDGKTLALVIDQVGNWGRHGAPDVERYWTLERAEKKPRAVNFEDDVPQRMCIGCTKPYPKYLVACPYCGMPFEPAGRGSVEAVDGDLMLLTPDVLAELRGEIEKASRSPQKVQAQMAYAGVAPHIIKSAVAGVAARLAAQDALGECMRWWGHYYARRGHDAREIQKLFYARFGIDPFTARTLDRAKTLKLAESITEEFARWTF